MPVSLTPRTALTVASTPGETIHPFAFANDGFLVAAFGFGSKKKLTTRSWLTLYEMHNVDVVLNGHIHRYERSWPVRAEKVGKTGVT